MQPREAWNLLDPVVIRIALEYDVDMSLLDSLMSVRRVLERDMARAASDRLTDDDLAALRANLEETQGAFGDYERFRALDGAFHTIIMRASGSEVGWTIVRAIHRHGGERPALAAAATRESLEQTAAEHRGIYEALAARDGERAAALVASHIEAAWAERKQAGSNPGT